MAPEESDPHGQNHDQDERAKPEQEYETRSESGEEPDVLLDVPSLNVEELSLELEDLRAHVSLRADLADVVSVNVGVDAYIDKAKLDVKGLEAQILLKVGLDRVLDTFNRALEVIDQNPEIVGRSRGSQPPAKDESHADEAGKISPETTILGREVGENGGTVVRSVSEIGELLETILDDSGEVTDERIVGSVEDLTFEGEFKDDAGRTVRRFKDGPGNIVERTLDERGNTVGLSVPKSSNDTSGLEATPSAEKKARDLGVNLVKVKGTGSGGRIVVKDVEKASRERT